MPDHLMGVTGMLVQAAWMVCAALAGLDYGSVLDEAPSNLFQHASLISGCAWMSLLALRHMHEKWPAASETAKPAARLRGTDC
jgi:hypothetical protein